MSKSCLSLEQSDIDGWQRLGFSRIEALRKGTSKNYSLYPTLQWAQLPLEQAAQPPPPAMGELVPSSALLKEAKREMALRALP